jgi:2-polyprenyl-3-methyl-5-hydroxy-6-metoxy-1,4-benzoquinol methylase
MMLRICRNKDQAVVNPNPANARRAQTEAEWERKWLLAPEEFNPLLTAAGRLRIERTWELIHPQLASPKLLCVDLGAGYGVLSSLCADAGARMTAADIAEGALKKIRLNQQISCEKQFVPYTTLPDMHYDLILATDLIAWLPENEYRLFFSELARLASRNGKIVVSTPLDVDSDNALERFLYLAETEISIESIRKSYHALQIRLLRLLNRWKWSQWLFGPLIRFIENSDRLLKALERLTQFLYDERGISHVIIAGTRRPIFQPPKEDELPIERKTKKSVWE